MIPYNTDAPIYHVPYTTIGLIVLNTLLFLGTPAWLTNPDIHFANDIQMQEMEEDEAVEFLMAHMQDAEFTYPWYTFVLEYGQGLKPWQWLTSIFMHADFFHLLFNMVFLWAFGLVVEGKVGPAVFLLLYLGIGISQSAMEQMLMLFAFDGASLGASAAVFGLLGIAMVWAPKNDFDVFWIFGFQLGTIEMPIMVFGLIKFALEVLSVVVGRFAVSGSMLHLMGFGLGVAAGFVWLKRGWVDCEGWDILHVMQGDEGARSAKEASDDEAAQLVRTSYARSGSETARPVSPTASPEITSRANHRHNTAADPNQLAESLYRSEDGQEGSKPVDSHWDEGPESRLEVDLERLFGDGQYGTAIKLIRKVQQGGTEVELSQPTLAQLIRGLLGQQSYEAAIPFMEEHARRFAVRREAMLLTLAKTLLHLERPRRAQKVLRSAQRLELDDRAKQQWRQLVAHSKQLIEDGTIEFSD